MGMLCLQLLCALKANTQATDVHTGTSIHLIINPSTENGLDQPTPSPLDESRITEQANHHSAKMPHSMKFNRAHRAFGKGVPTRGIWGCVYDRIKLGQGSGAPRVSSGFMSAAQQLSRALFCHG